MDCLSYLYIPCRNAITDFLIAQQVTIGKAEAKINKEFKKGYFSMCNMQGGAWL